MDKKVSIIIPIYNTEKYLEECLESVINQTYQNLEIILINDGSKDNSLKICKEFQKKDNRIILIDKENSGVSNTRNVGIYASTGDYITFVDSDDIVEKDAIETMVWYITNYNTDVVRTNFALNDFIGQIPKKLIGKTEKENMNNVLYYFLNAQIPAFMCLFLIKKEVILDNNLQLNEELVMMEDTLFFVNLVRYIDSIYISDKKTYNYRIHDESSSNSIKRVEKNIKSVIKVNEEINKIISNDLKEITNRTEFRIICDFIIKMYDYNYGDKLNVLKFLEQDISFNRMLNNLNYQKLNSYSKIIYDILKNKKIHKMNNRYKRIVFNRKIHKGKDVLTYKINRVYNKYLKNILKLFSKK